MFGFFDDWWDWMLSWGSWLVGQIVAWMKAIVCAVVYWFIYFVWPWLEWALDYVPTWMTDWGDKLVAGLATCWRIADLFLPVSEAFVVLVALWTLSLGIRVYRLGRSLFP